MKSRPNGVRSLSTTFDLLRSGLEADPAAKPPAIIAITSCTDADGKELAARGLAHAFAVTGYTTLFVDARVRSRNTNSLSTRTTTEDLARSIQPGTDSASVLNLSDPNLQKTSNQRNVLAAFDILRTKFSYVVVSTDPTPTSFRTALLAASNAVIVTVKTGRRETAADAQLRATLSLVGTHFLGVVALDPALIKNDPKVLTVDTGRDSAYTSSDVDGRRLRELAE